MRIYRALMLCAAAAFAGAILAAILRFGVDVPFWDQWGFVRALRQLSTGEISWARLFFVSQGEHQIGMQVLLSAAAWHVTGMYMPAVMVWNWITASLFCLLAMLVTRKELGAASGIPWTALGAAAFFVFNPAAYQVWMWGLPLVHLLIPLLYLAGVRVLQSRASGAVKICAAAALAAAASHILASGLLLWPLFAVLLPRYARPGALRRQRFAAAVAAVLFIASAAPFAIGSHPAPAAANGPSGARIAFEFFLAYTGNLVSLSTEALPVRWAQLAGAALLAFFAAALGLAWREFRGKPQRAALVMVWGSVGLYSIAAGALAALGRHRFGVAYAVESSRYVLASSFLPVACVVLGAMVIVALAAALPRRLHLYSWALCGTVGIMAAGMTFRVLQWPRAAGTMRGFRASELRGKVAVAAANVAEVDYREVSADSREEFRALCNYLNRRGWLRPPLWDEGFVRRLAALREEPAFGQVAEASVIGGQVRLAGFAYPADAVVVLADGVVLGAFLPGPDGKWSGTVATAAAPAALHCFAYDAATGEAHLLRSTPLASRNAS